MSGFLKYNTSASIMIGEFISSADGFTAASSLNLSASNILLSKNGGVLTSKNDSASAVTDPTLGGWYRCSLNTTDTNTLGQLQLASHVSGALPVWDSWMVIPANVYDSLVSNTDLLNISGSILLNTLVDGSYDLHSILQILAAVLAGKVSGGGTNTITFRNLSDALNRVVATVDSNGNRSAITIT
jgi:hypothetical protein